MTRMSSDSNKNEVPIEFTQSQCCPKDEKQTKVTSMAEKKRVKPNGSDRKRSSGKHCLRNLSLIAFGVGLVNVVIGIVILIRTKELPHWMTTYAFSIWYGCIVLVTGSVGLEYIRKRSSIKGILHALLNIFSLMLTLPCLAFYGKVVVYYHNIRKDKIVMQCADEADKKTYNCNEHYETLAVTAATLYGILLVLSVLEMLVSFLTSAYSSTFRAFCKRAFFTADDSYTPECSMYYPGPTHFPTSIGSTSCEYEIDPTPLRPVHVHKQKVYKPVNNPAAVPRAKQQQPRRITAQRKRPQFKAMESITESVESTDCENEAPVTTRAEEEERQREVLLPKIVQLQSEIGN